MRPVFLIAALLLSGLVHAREVPVSGRVTYLAAGLVYTSLGRGEGLDDSTMVRIMRGADTIAVLRVVALSSSSSACSVLAARGAITIGALATALVRKGEGRPDSTFSFVAPPRGEDLSAVGMDPPPPRKAPERPPRSFELRGRMSMQMRTLEYEEESFNLKQPGVVVSLQARSGRVPITADVYANMRSVSSGGTSLFGKEAVSQVRLYRAALSYDDGTTGMSIGRVSPSLAPTLGYVDGAVLQRRWRGWTFGGAAGFQPGPGYPGVSRDFTKWAVFSSYGFSGTGQGFVGGAYARTYCGKKLDREAVSGILNLSLSPTLSLYGNSEVDLRRKRGDEFLVRPALTSLYVTANYRVMPALTVGLGGDASRPLYSFAAVQAIPDSLVERRLVWGASFMVMVWLPAGISFSNTVTPRSIGSGNAQEYAEYATLAFTNIASSGVALRSNLSLSRSAYTTSLGYGAGLQKNILEVVDLTVRFQRYGYTVRRTGRRNTSMTVGTDVVIPLGSQLVLFASYELLDGYGSRSRSLFAELSMRF